MYIYIFRHRYLDTVRRAHAKSLADAMAQCKLVFTKNWDVEIIYV